jgi:HEAT repeat protein
MEPSPDIGALARALKDRSVSVRQRAARSLGQVPLEAARKSSLIAPALASVLDDSNKYVRAAAAFGLARVEDPRGMPVLTELLRDEHRDVRAAVAIYLGELGDLARLVIPALEAAAKDAQPEVRQRASEALAKIRK